MIIQNHLQSNSFWPRLKGRRGIGKLFPHERDKTEDFRYALLGVCMEKLEAG